MVRAANTGVTCFVDEFGRVTQMLQDTSGGPFTEGVLIGDVTVPADGNLTFYARHGELFAQVCAGITILTLVSFIALTVRRKPRVFDAGISVN
jgi:apolipoprotein N-acyltransferase